MNEVALSIFKELSIAFERQQASTDPPRLPVLPAGSSFAHEDLPSNLIGFYMAVRGFRRPDIMTFCRGLDVSSSVAEFRRNHNFVQNFSFRPIGATGPWPPELATINDSAAATLYETQRIFPTQNLRFSYCPMYRVVGSLRSSLVDLPNQPRFSVTDDLRVVPTTFETSSDTGIMNYIRVRPARPSDEARFRQVGALWPRDLSVQVLQCLTSQGNPD
ncbi:MAG TPA: hypothetical protein VFT44_04930 [Pyrinomonadaceae bacterium]|nr:hypothetical protein [Pyrinomonadaceae bacterium]